MIIRTEKEILNIFPYRVEGVYGTSAFGEFNKWCREKDLGSHGLQYFWQESEFLFQIDPEKEWAVFNRGYLNGDFNRCRKIIYFKNELNAILFKLTFN